MLAEGGRWKLRSASPYSSLFMPAAGDKGTGWVVPFRPDEGDRYKVGPYLAAELQDAIKRLKADKSLRPREREKAFKVGLWLSVEPHLCTPCEGQVTVNPQYLLDGLGRWPAVMLHSPGRLTILTEDTAYVVGLIRCGDNWS
jgi:hypothetical protein